MPQFKPGESKTGKVVMRNPTEKAFDYTGFLYMGADLAVMSEVPFSLSAGQEKRASFPVTMPAKTGVYPVHLGVFSEGQSIALYRAIEDVAIVGPSDLLYQYQAVLEDAYIHVEAGYPNNWVMIPGYGLQYASAAVLQLKSLMVEEAIRIGMISSSAEAYFERAIMYFSDGTTIVPYWWPCPYCPEKFRSPEELAQHKEEVHADILLTKATITSFGYQLECVDPPWCDYWDAVGFQVSWRNDSPFAITGRVSIPRTTPQDASLAPGQSVTVYLSPPYMGYSIVATLTLVGEPLPGMGLDTESRDLFR